MERHKIALFQGLGEVARDLSQHISKQNWEGKQLWNSFMEKKKFSQSQLNQQSRKPLKNSAELETLENYSSPPLKVVKYLCVRAQSSFFKLNMTHPLSISWNVFFYFPLAENSHLLMVKVLASFLAAVQQLICGKRLESSGKRWNILLTDAASLSWAGHWTVGEQPR